MRHSLLALLFLTACDPGPAEIRFFIQNPTDLQEELLAGVASVGFDKQNYTFVDTWEPGSIRFDWRPDETSPECDPVGTSSQQHACFIRTDDGSCRYSVRLIDTPLFHNDQYLQQKSRETTHFVLHAIGLSHTETANGVRGWPVGGYSGIDTESDQADADERLDWISEGCPL